MEKCTETYPLAIRIIHAGLVIFGLGAFVTGELAEEVEHGFTTGYWLHAYFGLSLAVFLLGHYIYRMISGGRSVSRWLPGKNSVYSEICEDIRELARFRLPFREGPYGIAGLVQTFGLLVFLWMSITGIILYLVGGPEVSGFAHTVAEMHEETGEVLIPVFLFLHIGAVILHSVAGHAILRRINPFMK